MKELNATYLGDGAYIKRDEYTGDVVIFTYNGIQTTNRVVIETRDVSTLMEWLYREGFNG